MPLSPRTLRPANTFTPRSISGLALWLDASASGDLYTTDAGPVVPVSSPTEIAGCVLWLDGADNATITASGGLVSQWTDKSASGAVLTASGSARPTLSSTGFNSRQAIVFNGTSTNMASVSPYTATNGLSGMTRIAVCQNATANALVARVTTGGSDSFVNMNGSWRSAVDGTSGTNFVTSTTFSSGNNLPAGVYADVFSSGTITQYGFGANAAATVSGTIPSTTGTGTPTLNVGSNQGANFFWNGPIAEVIYFNRALTRAELARVEAYLAQRWGITGVHASATSASDPVGYWRDRSGNGRHATQTVGANRPVVASENNRRALAFDGSNGVLVAASATPTGGGATLFIAHRRTANDNGGLHGFTGDGLENHHPFTTLGFYDGFASGTRRNWAQPYSTARSLYSVVSGTSWVAYSDGAAVNTVTGVTPASQAAGFAQCFGAGRFIASTSVASRHAGAYICEAIVYSRALTTSERQRVERYLAQRWGITLAPQVSNADAQDWVNRVYANGGTVSASTAAAVNQFCLDIENAPGGSLRDRFYRLNLFCGNSDASLAAVRTPLFRGPSLTGTQYGNATDTNGNFVQGDYAENDGLLGNSTTKWLNTGFTADTAGLTAASFHMSAVWPSYSHPAGSNYFPIALINAAANLRLWINPNSSPTPTTEVATFLGQSGTNFASKQIAATNGATISGGLWLISRTSTASLRLYNGASEQASNTTTISDASVPTLPMGVFARWNGTSTFGHAAMRLRGYSVGLGLTAQQVSDFNAAMTTLQTALGRA